MAVEPHQPVSPMALSHADPLPALGGGGGPSGLEVSFCVSGVVLEDVAGRRVAVGEVGVPPHHAVAKAHATSHASPSVRGEQGI
jgi:hypothetical protein